MRTKRKLIWLRIWVVWATAYQETYKTLEWIGKERRLARNIFHIFPYTWIEMPRIFFFLFRGSFGLSAFEEKSSLICWVCFSRHTHIGEEYSLYQIQMLECCEYMRPGPVKASRNDHRQISWGLEFFHLMAVISTTSICQRSIYMPFRGDIFYVFPILLPWKMGHQIRNEKFQGTSLLRDRRGYPVNPKKYSIRFDFTYPIKMGSNSRYFDGSFSKLEIFCFFSTAW